jgi:hypothetical protein
MLNSPTQTPQNAFCKSSWLSLQKQFAGNVARIDITLINQVAATSS